MTQSPRFRAALEALHSGEGVLVVPLDDGGFAVFGRGTHLYGIVEQLWPSFIRGCARRQRLDYVASALAHQLRVGEDMKPTAGQAPKNAEDLGL